MKFIPSFKVFACKYGNSDLLYDTFLSIVIFGRIFFVNINEINSEETYETIRWITLGSFSLILLGYFIIFFSRPYYNSFQQKLKSFQILYLLCLMAFSIIIRETEFGLVKTQNSAMILLCLTLTVLLKSNNNLLRTDISRLIKKSQHLKTISTKDLLTIYYLLQNYVKYHLIGVNSPTLNQVQHNEDKEVTFLVKYLLEQHKLKCKKMVCYCKKSYIKIDSSCWIYYKEYFKGNFVFEALNLMNDLLRDAIKIKAIHVNYIFYCYIHFLTFYLNKPSLAYKMVVLKKNSF